MLVKILKLFWFILLTPLILCLLVVFFPIGIYFSLRDRNQYKRFCRTHNNKMLLVCTTRHSWKDFLENNVFPTLPQTVIIEWYYRRYRDENPVNICLFWMGQPKPFLAKITLEGIKSISLNHTLQTLKKSAKRDVDVQRQVRGILEEKLQELSDL